MTSEPRLELLVAAGYDLCALVHRIEALVTEAGARAIGLDSITALFSPRPPEHLLRAHFQMLIETFRKLSRRSYASGLGALYAYESQFPAVASAKIEGLIDRYGITGEDTLRFFRVHETADVEHSSVCQALLDRLPEAEQAEAVAAGEELAGALWNFLSGVEARASIH